MSFTATCNAQHTLSCHSDESRNLVTLKTLASNIVSICYAACLPKPLGRNDELTVLIPN